MIKIISLLVFLVQLSLALPILAKVDVVENSHKTSNDTIIFLNIPQRNANAITGTEFVNQVVSLNLTEREKRVVKEILSGNVPSFSHKLRALKINQIIDGKSYELVFFAVCDYMAIGSDDDYLYIPMTPSTAQYLADRMECLLPTKKIVDVVYNKAEIKLKPQPIPPSDKMITIPVFKQHTDSIKQQISQKGIDRSANNIIAGHKKDIIISNKIYSNDRNYERVVIYGWHTSVNNPIQPVYNGHIATYADYSHGARLIFKTAFLNGDSVQVEDILNDQKLSKLLSSEGVIKKPYYPKSNIFTTIESRLNNSQINFNLKQNYPNPFNPATTISYTIPKITHSFVVTSEEKEGNGNLARQILGGDVFTILKVYDTLGREVVTLVEKEQKSGSYRVLWNGRNKNGKKVTSGVYFYQLRIANFFQTKKMIMTK